MSNNNKKKGLGKGMGSLLDGYSLENIFNSEINETEIDKKDINKVQDTEILISYIKVNKNQPRKIFDQESLNDLAQSIKEQGIIQPIVVEKISEREFSIIAGERRYRAAKMAGLKKVPVFIKDLNNLNRLELALIENIQREDLNPIEEANAYYSLLQESGLTQEELSKKIGKSRSAISNSIRLLQLPKEMQKGLIEGVFSSGHARALLSLINPADRIILLEKLKKDELSVREAEKIAKNLNSGKRDVSKKKKEKVCDKEVSEIQDKFIQAVGNKVHIKGNLSKGSLLLKYNSVKELNELFHRLSKGDDLFEV
ncbi:MAG: ParB/RepB/Spo0J family partition protein [Pleomorphochaeta sp.]